MKPRGSHFEDLARVVYPFPAMGRWSQVIHRAWVRLGVHETHPVCQVGPKNGGWRREASSLRTPPTTWASAAAASAASRRRLGKRRARGLGGCQRPKTCAAGRIRVWLLHVCFDPLFFFKRTVSREPLNEHAFVWGSARFGDTR